MDKTPLQIADAALLAVYRADEHHGAPTGVPSCDGTNLAPAARLQSLAGCIPANVVWTADRGNWMWDGALAVMEAIGIDVTQPL